jgi:hypothetical protein
MISLLQPSAFLPMLLDADGLLSGTQPCITNITITSTLPAPL